MLLFICSGIPGDQNLACRILNAKGQRWNTSVFYLFVQVSLEIRTWLVGYWMWRVRLRGVPGMKHFCRCLQNPRSAGLGELLLHVNYKSSSHMACFSEDLKCWEAWDTTCEHKAKDITPSFAWRKGVFKEEALDDLPQKDKRGPSSIRWTLELF